MILELKNDPHWKRFTGGDMERSQTLNRNDLQFKLNFSFYSSYSNVSTCSLLDKQNNYTAVVTQRCSALHRNVKFNENRRSCLIGLLVLLLAVAIHKLVKDIATGNMFRFGILARTSSQYAVHPVAMFDGTQAR